MKHRVLLSLGVCFVGIAAVAASPAQVVSQQGFMASMHSDINEAQQKIVGLANAIPESAYKTRKGRSKAQIVADLEASFMHLHRAIGVNSDANLTEHINWFGSERSRLDAMVGTVTDLHEHLGQLIAYARSNNVKPPWSN